ncbi:MAG: EamA family transporter [Cyanobacteria bacterium P01_H01_bin.58]
MGQLDNTSNTPRDEEKVAREVLRSVTDHLRGLQNDLTDQFTQDITRLQGTKHRLLNDLDILEEEYQSLRHKYETLKNEHEIELSRKQLAQQQLWAKRLAQALATHLQTRLTETIYSGASVNGGSGQTGSLHNAYQLLASLDASLNDTLHSLQQDLNSYQSSLSQQISRMHSMEHQGEAILEALIQRLSLQLQAQVAQPKAFTSMPNGNGPAPYPYGYGTKLPQSPATIAQGRSGAYESALPPTAPAPVSAPKQTSPKQNPLARSSAFQKGLLFILLSTIALSIHNVFVGIIGYGGEIFGQLPIDAVFELSSIPNSLTLLWLRMLVVLPLMMFLASQLYPRIWQDLRQFLTAENKRPIFQVVASGCFLFMSQVLIYMAISEIGPGIAVTLLFMYPLITVPLAWFLFGERPTLLRVLVMFAIAAGVTLAALPNLNLPAGDMSRGGILVALLSSGAFALYLISMQLSFRKLHPVPVSLVQFSTIFILTSVILLGGRLFNMEVGQPSSGWGLAFGGVLLGFLTLVGYLCNNYGVRLMGAAQASIIASTGPVLTAIMARLITPGAKSDLAFIQTIGILMVTLGVLALSLERLKKPKAKPKRA